MATTKTTTLATTFTRIYLSPQAPPAPRPREILAAGRPAPAHLPAKAIEHLLTDADKLSQRRLAITGGGDCPASAVPPGTGIMPTDAGGRDGVDVAVGEGRRNRGRAYGATRGVSTEGDAVSWIERPLDPQNCGNALSCNNSDNGNVFEC